MKSGRRANQLDLINKIERCFTGNGGREKFKVVLYAGKMTDLLPSRTERAKRMKLIRQREIEGRLTQKIEWESNQVNLTPKITTDILP